MRRLLLALMVVSVLASVVPADAGYRPPTRYAGSYQHAMQSEPGGSYDYWTYTPSTYRASRPAPLVVVVHGCEQGWITDPADCSGIPAG